MNKQHLIALDLDGTLLTDNKIISTRTKHTIAKAKEQGHIVVISTGRPFRASYDYYKELGSRAGALIMASALAYLLYFLPVILIHSQR